jgi:hypothetical protein
MSYSNTGVQHAIKNVSDTGRNLVLDDDSRWAVSALGRLESIFWLPLDNVIVRPYHGATYKIEHKRLTGKIEVIEATYLGS